MIIPSSSEIDSDSETVLAPTLETLSASDINSDSETFAALDVLSVSAIVSDSFLSVYLETLSISDIDSEIVCVTVCPLLVTSVNESVSESGTSVVQEILAFMNMICTAPRLVPSSSSRYAPTAKSLTPLPSRSPT